MFLLVLVSFKILSCTPCFGIHAYRPSCLVLFFDFPFFLLSLSFLPFYSLVAETGRKPVGFCPLSLHTARLARFFVFIFLYFRTYHSF